MNEKKIRIESPKHENRNRGMDSSKKTEVLWEFRKSQKSISKVQKQNKSFKVRRNMYRKWFLDELIEIHEEE